MNEAITHQVIQTALDCGVREFIICAGSRNSSFVEALRIENRLKTYYWPEERSAAFFALGRTRLTKCPVAIVTTSGTAAGELLPAAMEAYYSGQPLLLITADRPEYFRGSGAPQSAEQEHLFGPYTPFFQKVSKNEPCDLLKWDQRSPAHLNVCLEEPQKQPKFVGKKLQLNASFTPEFTYNHAQAEEKLNRFFDQVAQPMVIVSTLPSDAREAVCALLLKLGLPVMLEAISGLREDPRLQHLRIHRTAKVLETAHQQGYTIDGVLRIGGVPTHRIWRDLEYLSEDIHVCAISELSFSGLSWNRRVACVPIRQFLSNYMPKHLFSSLQAKAWLQAEKVYETQLIELFNEEPAAEPALFYSLSQLIAPKAHVYLANSLPIREWDMAAISKSKELIVNANRGVNGIDGQISTFLGLCQPARENWMIVGDLTTIYDMAGPWILPQLEPMQINIVVINNGGGKIFEKLYPYQEMLNAHSLNFEPLANMWGLSYERCEGRLPKPQKSAHRLIEIIPDEAANKRLEAKISQLKPSSATVSLVESLRACSESSIG